MRNSNLLGKRLASSTNEDYQHHAQMEYGHSSSPSISGEQLAQLSKTVRERLNKIFGEEIHQRSKEESFKQTMAKTIDGILKDDHIEINTLDKNKFINDMINDILGFGLLQPLIDDETISEIMVVGPNRVYMEQNGIIQLTDIKFPDKRSVSLLIDKIVGPLGRRCDESTPNVDARLPDGSRVSASIQPIALDGPYITIRKFGNKQFKLEDYVKTSAVSQNMADFIKACVQSKLNIVVSGGTGSGKTTLLNCLSSYIGDHERIITIEDSAELQLTQTHVERYEARNANVEGKGQITIRDLVIYSLRKRPDRIVVGEIRGGEAIDMLQAMNTGHDGSLTTGHANTPKDMLNRLETMALMGMDLPIRAIREQIAGAVDIIVQIARLKDGSRKIVAITEVVGMGKEAGDVLGLRRADRDTIYVQDIFRFVQTGIDDDGKVQGHFAATGYQPQCLERFEMYGARFDVSVLKEEA